MTDLSKHILPLVQEPQKALVKFVCALGGKPFPNDQGEIDSVGLYDRLIDQSILRTICSYRSVIDVGFVRCEFSPSWLGDGEVFDALTVLVIDHCRITKLLGKLQEFPSVTRLMFCESDVDDTDIANLEFPTAISFLSLQKTRISSQVASQIEKLPLESIWLGGTCVDDEIGPSLAKLHQARTILLNETLITDRTLEFLRGCSALTNLRLDGTKVSNKGLQHLQACTSLESLDVENTLCGDGLAEFVEHMPSLREVRASGSQCSVGQLMAIENILRER